MENFIILSQFIKPYIYLNWADFACQIYFFWVKKPSPDGGPVVKTPHFHCKGYRFSPCGWSSKISHAMQYSQKKFINVFKTLKQTLMCLVCIHINFQGDYMNFDSDIKCFHSFFSFPIYFLRCDLRCMSFFGVT